MLILIVLYHLSYVLTYQNLFCSYTCSYGPEDKREEWKTTPRRSIVKKRGCQCHFIIKVMVQDPDVAIITYNMYDHEDGQGWPCHGKRDTLGDDGPKTKPILSRDMMSYWESLFFLQVPSGSVCKMHIKKYVDIHATTRDRDFFLHRKDIVNIYNHLTK